MLSSVVHPVLSASSSGDFIEILSVPMVARVVFAANGN